MKNFLLAFKMELMYYFSDLKHIYGSIVVSFVVLSFSTCEVVQFIYGQPEQPCNVLID